MRKKDASYVVYGTHKGGFFMQKFKNVKTLTTVSMLLAVAVVLGFFKIPITELIELRFQFLPITVGSMLYGPIVGGVLGGLTDILAYLVKPTGVFFPGFTFSSILAGVIYGFFFHKKKISLPRVIAGVFVETVICSILLNSLFLSILYGTPFWTVIVSRLLKTVIMFPINVALLYAILRPAGVLLPKISGIDMAG